MTMVFGGRIHAILLNQARPRKGHQPTQLGSLPPEIVQIIQKQKQKPELKDTD